MSPASPIGGAHLVASPFRYVTYHAVTLGRLSRLRSGPLLAMDAHACPHDRRLGATSRAQRGFSHLNGDHGATGEGRRVYSVGARLPASGDGATIAEGVKWRWRLITRKRAGRPTSRAPSTATQRDRPIDSEFCGLRPAGLSEAWAAQCSYCEQRAAHASLLPAQPRAGIGIHDPSTSSHFTLRADALRRLRTAPPPQLPRLREQAWHHREP